MYIMYVDESGDPGSLPSSPSQYFVLAGMVVHEAAWASTLESLIDFRRKVRKSYGLKLRDEIHAAEFIRRPSGMTVPKWQRLQLLGDVLENVASMRGVSIVSVKVDKGRAKAGFNAFDVAWRALIQRFDNTIAARNFPAPMSQTEHGIIVADRTDEMRLRGIVRKMRRYNVVPGMNGLPPRSLPVGSVIKDPIMRDSNHSYFVQTVDVVAYFLHQKFAPNGYVKKQGARNYFDRLSPVVCRAASPREPLNLGIVHL